ncbi:MAG: CAP domain-containing protein [Chloroflexota bacterium]
MSIDMLPQVPAKRFTHRLPRFGIVTIFCLLSLVWSPGTLLAQEPTCKLNGDEAYVASLMQNSTEQNRAHLKCNGLLAVVARQRANDMAQRGYFSHVSPDGIGPNYLVEAAGYQLPDWWGDSLSANYVESIAAGYTDVDQAWQGWMDSPSHSQHILGKISFFAEQTNYGIGVVDVPGSRYGKYYVVITAPPQ